MKKDKLWIVTENITEILHLYDKSQNLLKKEEKYTKIKLNVIENKKKGGNE